MDDTIQTITTSEEATLFLIRGLQATVAKQAELIASLRREVEDLKAHRRPTMAISSEYPGSTR